MIIETTATSMTINFIARIPPDMQTPRFMETEGVGIHAPRSASIVLGDLPTIRSSEHFVD